MAVAFEKTVAELARANDGQGLTMLTETLEAHGVYISDEHGIQLSVPAGYSAQPPAGPILLERTAEVVVCGDQAFFIASVVHCFPCGARFDDTPLLLDFSPLGIGDGAEHQVRS